jgi:hypothetical protein
MPTVSPFDILSSAQKLVASGWCQGATARDERGEEVAPWSQDACTWSAAGAIAAAWRAQCGSPSQAPEVEVEAFTTANHALAGSMSTAPDKWNDAPGRTQRQVLQAFNRSAVVLEAPLPDPSR